MGERSVEHYVSVADDTALVVYCSFCALTLAEYTNNNVVSQLQARMTAHDHKSSYSRDHTVVIADMRDHRLEYQKGTEFTDASDHD